MLKALQKIKHELRTQWHRIIITVLVSVPTAIITNILLVKYF